METRCAYCNKPLQRSEAVKSTLIYCNGAQLARKENEYCSSRCAEHDQMAHDA